MKGERQGYWERGGKMLGGEEVGRGQGNGDRGGNTGGGDRWGRQVGAWNGG